MPISETTLPAIPVAIALGANLGDRAASLRAAVAGLRDVLTVTALSPVYETPAAYVADQPAFLNAALIGHTQLAPLTLLWAIKKLETELGRQPTFHYGPRLIDIDLLLYGDQVLAMPELTVPHARMAEREFVLRPLADIAAAWRHPQTGLTVAAMLAELPDAAAKRTGDILLAA